MKGRSRYSEGDLIHKCVCLCERDGFQWYSHFSHEILFCFSVFYSYSCSSKGFIQCGVVLIPVGCISKMPNERKFKKAVVGRLSPGTSFLPPVWNFSHRKLHILDQFQ